MAASSSCGISRVDTGRPPRPRELAIQRFTADGVALAPAVRMPVSPRVNDATPRIVGDETGGYLLTWTGGQLGTDVTPMGQRLDAAGVPVGKTFQVDVSNKNQSIGHSTAIAALPASEVIVWFDGGPGDGILSRRFDRLGTQLQTPVVVIGASGSQRMEVLATGDGGFVVAFGSGGTGARAFDSVGLPRAEAFVVSSDASFAALAANPAADVFAAVMTRPAAYVLAGEIWLQRFTRDGVLLGPEVLVHDAGPDMHVIPSVAFDAERQPDRDVVRGRRVRNDLPRPRARSHRRAHRSGGDAADRERRSARCPHRPSRRRVPLPQHLAAGRCDRGRRQRRLALCARHERLRRRHARIPSASGATRGSATATPHPTPVAPIVAPRSCGDGIIDTAEECDDGNTDDCDGCSSACHAEIGLVCGDGIPYPACGQSCDDGNLVDRDGCSATCALERIPGGGSPSTECYTEWVVDDPVNEPYLDADGAVSGTQRCVDDDPSCDFDGGVPGACTFHVARLRQQHRSRALRARHPPRELEHPAPSATKAARDPAAAAVRDALTGVVLPSIVGPSAPDVCSPTADVTVPLRAVASGYATRKLTLKTRATLYDGAKDGDKLRLICLPRP